MPGFPFREVLLGQTWRSEGTVTGDGCLPLNALMLVYAQFYGLRLRPVVRLPLVMNVNVVTVAVFRLREPSAFRQARHRFWKRFTHSSACALQSMVSEGPFCWQPWHDFVGPAYHYR